MQSTDLFVAGSAVRVGVGCWMGQDPASPGLRSETWGTRSWGGEGCAISRVAVRA